MIPTVLAAGLALCMPQDPGRAPEVDVLLVRAARIVLAPDQELKDEAILVRGGKVVAIGAAVPRDLPAGARRLDLAGKTVVAGFVDAHQHLGQGEDLVERADPATPELRAADAFDPFDPQLATLVRGGVTTIGFAPRSGNVIAGLATVLKTHDGAVLREDGYLKMALTGDALDVQRKPTSLLGAAELVRKAFTAARDPRAANDPAARALLEAATGARALVVHVEAQAEVHSALALCEELQLQPVLLGCAEAWRMVPRLGTLRATVLVPPLGAEMRAQELGFPAALERAGARVGFTAQRGQRRVADPGSLRRSAALAVRAGLSRKAALAALTTVPAEVLGMAERVGSLQSGRDADFLVFSGDPLDLGSRLESVYVAGRALPAQEASR
ncbi:MAG: amidohydrolase family protein [Planctomycetes bacterium]|nr:amidohydrolase family protein [Planctomycetota bacterium]